MMTTIDQCDAQLDRILGEDSKPFFKMYPEMRDKLEGVIKMKELKQKKMMEKRESTYFDPFVKTPEKIERPDRHSVDKTVQNKEDEEVDNEILL